MKNAFEYEDELAALREELATAKRANYNAEVALKAAYEVQELWKGRTTNLTHTNVGLQQRLTAAEQRNAELCRELADSKELVQVIAKRAAISELRNLELSECLEGVCNTLYCQSSEGADALERARAALKPTESGASA
jgi:hypothetical protein